MDFISETCGGVYILSNVGGVLASHVIPIPMTHNDKKWYGSGLSRTTSLLCWKGQTEHPGHPDNATRPLDKLVRRFGQVRMVLAHTMFLPGNNVIIYTAHFLFCVGCQRMAVIAPTARQAGRPRSIPIQDCLIWKQ